MATKAPANTFTLYRGTSPVLRFTVDPDTVSDSDPETDWTTTYTMRQRATSADPVALQADGAWNADESTIDVAITRAQMLALDAGTYVGALFRTDSGSEDELSHDAVTVKQGIFDAP